MDWDLRQNTRETAGQAPAVIFVCLLMVATRWPAATHHCHCYSQPCRLQPSNLWVKGEPFLPGEASVRYLVTDTRKVVSAPITSKALVLLCSTIYRRHMYTTFLGSGERHG